MERKTKHRLLGIVVLAGLGVLLIPLLQSDKTISAQTSVMKAPPFPDQPVQVSSEPDRSVAPTPAAPAMAAPAAPPVGMPDPDEDMPDSASLNPPLPIQQNIDREEQPDDTISATHASSEPAQYAAPPVRKSTATEAEVAKPALQPTAEVSENPAIKETDIQNSIASEMAISATPVKQEAPSPKVVKTVVKTLPKKLPEKMRSAMATPKGDNGLTEITNAGWVIQVGSFKNKTSALKMVNHLRANGYRAFMQKTSSTFGENTRVFIGPEPKQHSAFTLADQLESDLHIRGIVISYKPLSL